MRAITFQIATTSRRCLRDGIGFRDSISMILRSLCSRSGSSTVSKEMLMTAPRIRLRMRFVHRHAARPPGWACKSQSRGPSRKTP